MCQSIRDDKRSEIQGGRREAMLKEGRSKETAIRTETGSEAGCGR